MGLGENQRKQMGLIFSTDFSLNICCRIIGDRLIEPFVFEHCLSAGGA